MNFTAEEHELMLRALDFAETEGAIFQWSATVCYADALLRSVREKLANDQVNQPTR